MGNKSRESLAVPNDRKSRENPRGTNQVNHETQKEKDFVFLHPSRILRLSVLRTRFLSALQRGAIRSRLGPSPVSRWTTVSGGRRFRQSTIKSQYESNVNKGNGLASYSQASSVPFSMCRSWSLMPSSVGVKEDRYSTVSSISWCPRPVFRMTTAGSGASLPFQAAGSPASYRCPVQRSADER